MAGYNNNYRRGGRKDDRYSPEVLDAKFPMIQEPLSRHYKDFARMMLPEGEADKLGEDFKDIPPHQMRKVLDQAKLAMTQITTDPHLFPEARRLLYALLPMAAYNAGRMKELKPLYYFLKANISAKTIQTNADIEVFDDLYTSIIAYHKLYSKK